ncbi:MAG: TPM domain-containing protein [Bacteroidota bacterium]
MKYFQLLAFFLCPLFLLAQAPTVYTIETVPNPKDSGNGYVSDPGNIIGTAAIAEINSIAAAVENAATAEIAVVVLPTIGDQNPKDFSTALFNHWGIGKAGKDNGLLILTVMDQRRTEFETGYGMEGVLPDVLCYRVGMQVLVPYFQQGNYGDGLVATVQRFQQIMQDPAAQEELRAEKKSYGQDRRRQNEPWQIALLIYAAISLLIGVFQLRHILLTKWSKDELYDKYKKIHRFNTIFLAIGFPIPCLPIFLYARSLLKMLRNHPRFSKINGKPMRKLSEEEEDEYLEKGQITEEEIKSVNYDVWITDNADDILILRYERQFTKYDPCPECHFKTYYKSHSEVVQAATYHSTGTRELTYSCKNCNYSHIKFETIPMKTRSSGGGSSGSSGGGGSWGGGSSGGGGAGVSW